ncbi:MAG: hypothetical protein M1812_003958 [Candelaria pacifica]|nr:MAG: hypothetical protein M1812_003958 [Candelaria pacifica]
MPVSTMAGGYGLVISPFGLLPQKIRVKILRYLLRTDVMITNPNLLQCEPSVTAWPRVKGLDPAIMRTCIQLHHEGYSVLYGCNTFRFTSFTDLCSEWTLSRFYPPGGKTYPMTTLLVRFEYIDVESRKDFVEKEVVAAIRTIHRYPHLFANLRLLKIDASEWDLTGAAPLNHSNPLLPLLSILLGVFPFTDVFYLVGQLGRTILVLGQSYNPSHPWGPHFERSVFVLRPGSTGMEGRTAGEARASNYAKLFVSAPKHPTLLSAGSHHTKKRLGRLRSTKNTRQQSPFMRLPPEIRMIIYNLILVADNTIINPNSLFPAKRSCLWPVGDIDSKLISTCRLIRNETRPILYGKNTFLFTSAFALREFTHAIGSPSQDMIKTMIFFQSWHTMDWLPLPKVPSPTWISPSHDPHLSLRGLRRLTIDLAFLESLTWDVDTGILPENLVYAFASIVGRKKLDTLRVLQDVVANYAVFERVLERKLLKPKDAPSDLWEPKQHRRSRTMVVDRRNRNPGFIRGSELTLRARDALDSSLNTAFGVGQEIKFDGHRIGYFEALKKLVAEEMELSNLLEGVRGL